MPKLRNALSVPAKHRRNAGAMVHKNPTRQAAKDAAIDEQLGEYLMKNDAVVIHWCITKKDKAPFTQEEADNLTDRLILQLASHGLTVGGSITLEDSEEVWEEEEDAKDG